MSARTKESMIRSDTWFKPQPERQRVEDKIAWMTEFLADYGLRVVQGNGE